MIWQIVLVMAVAIVILVAWLVLRADDAHRDARRRNPAPSYLDEPWGDR